MCANVGRSFEETQLSCSRRWRESEEAERIEDRRYIKDGGCEGMAYSCEGIEKSYQALRGNMKYHCIWAKRQMYCFAAGPSISTSPKEKMPHTKSPILFHRIGFSRTDGLSFKKGSRAA